MSGAARPAPKSVPPTPPMPSTPLTIGTKVTCTRHFNSMLTIGAHGVITAIDHSDELFPFEVQWEDHTELYWMKASEIKEAPLP